jgi:hypothetical protein
VDELVELGHDVTLFASGDSRTKGELHAVWPRPVKKPKSRFDKPASKSPSRPGALDQSQARRVKI